MAPTVQSNVLFENSHAVRSRPGCRRLDQLKLKDLVRTKDHRPAASAAGRLDLSDLGSVHRSAGRSDLDRLR